MHGIFLRHQPNPRGDKCRCKGIGYIHCTLWVTFLGFVERRAVPATTVTTTKREREKYESATIRNTPVVITDVRDMVECGDGGGPWPSVRIPPPPPSSWSNGRVRICTHHHYLTTAHTHATTTTRDMVQDSFDDNNKTSCNNNNDTTKFP